MFVETKQQVNEFMSKKVITEVPTSGNSTKLKKRYRIEKQTLSGDDNDYDIYDIAADLSNTLKSLLKVINSSENLIEIKEKLSEDKSIIKFLNRQNQIEEILKTF